MACSLSVCLAASIAVMACGFAGCGRIPLDLGGGTDAGQGGSAVQSGTAGQGSAGQGGVAGQSGTAGQGSAGQSGSVARVDAAHATASAVAIASDVTGTKLVMVGGGIWTSTNGGTTWIERAPSGLPHIQAWTSVASDATGTNLVAVVSVFFDRPEPIDNPASFSGDVWTSTDSGDTWSDKTTSGSAHGQEWRSVASDESGTRLVAATAGLGMFGGPGAVWTSNDAGVTWTNRTAAQAGMGTQSWSAVASDATGTKLIAVGPGSGVWASADAGMTWTDRTPPDPKFEASFGNQVEGWHNVASDASGTHLVAAVDTGDSWTSTDGGITWTDVVMSGISFGLASDSTGTNVVAVGVGNDGNGDIWTSTNGGLTWIDQTTHIPRVDGAWVAVASNADGNHVVAVAHGAIWIK
jgi:hypothetical protein